MSDNSFSQEIKSFYSSGKEATRLLSKALGAFERKRTNSILKRYLPSKPCVILDIGGGAGIYAFDLAGQAHIVYLLDPIPLHIEQARKQAGEHPGSSQLAGYTVGDARELPYPDTYADVVLLFGPLYHLLEHKDRMQAVSEAYRTLKPGGLVLAAGISRYASVLDAFTSDIISDKAVQAMLKTDVTTGCHYSPEGLQYFTTAYFHKPEELEQELLAAGFSNIELLAIEGPLFNLPNFEAIWQDENKRALLFWFTQAIEKERSLLGASAHFMALGYKSS